MARIQRQKLVRREVADPLSLQMRDIALLRDLWEYRFLNTEQILALHPGGERNRLRRLAAMYDLGFLDRPKTQGHARLRSSHTVYALDKKGAEVLGKDAGEREGILRRIRETKHTSALISHSLMISQFRVCLTLALKSTDTKLVKWLQGNDLKKALSARGQHPELVPDAFFTLEDKGDLLHFFLEADRGTMSQARFVSKLKVYWKWWSEKRCEESLGMTRFRVLTITPNNARSENLRKVSKEADERKQGSLMFLFAPEALYSVTLPQPILEKVWRSPKDDIERSIIE
jgi:hypothetical protein